MRTSILVAIALIGPVAIVGGLGESPDHDDTPHSRVEVAVAALTLSGTNGACRSVEVENGASPREVAWSPTIGNQRGDGGGSATYVDTCDAADGAQSDLVSLELLGIRTNPANPANPANPVGDRMAADPGEPMQNDGASNAHVTIARIVPQGAGNLCAGACGTRTGVTDSEDVLDQVAVNRGRESLSELDKVHWRLALGAWACTEAAINGGGCVTTASTSISGTTSTTFAHCHDPEGQCAVGCTAGNWGEPPNCSPCCDRVGFALIKERPS